MIAQFLCTSLWFAGNGVMSNIIQDFALETSALWTLTIMVQLGFIIGTVLFAVLTIVDRYSPSKVFFICAVLGSAVNFAMLWDNNSMASLSVLRFLTGFLLAGIYPVGMKIAADYYKNGLGKALGFLVGALVLGTALPHLLKDIAANLPWKTVIITISALSIVGGSIVLLFIKDGPFRKKGGVLQLKEVRTFFKNKEFKIAAMGYFGHMWELYSFWVFVPLLINHHIKQTQQEDINVSLWSFIFIAIGALGCIFAGYFSAIIGVKKTAFLFLSFSLGCCILSPFLLSTLSTLLFLIFMIVWGFAVAGDSPLFSSLVANNVAAETKGTAITTVTSIGFLVTVCSIQLLGYLVAVMDFAYLFLVLAIGPAISVGFYLIDRYQTNAKTI